MTQSTTGLVELKGCPFCGDDKPKLLCGGAGNYFIQCGRCNATSDDRTREHAITAWNTRPTDPTIAELVAALEEIADETRRKQLPITALINEIATKALTLTKSRSAL